MKLGLTEIERAWEFITWELIIQKYNYLGGDVSKAHRYNQIINKFSKVVFRPINTVIKKFTGVDFGSIFRGRFIKNYSLKA